MSNNLVSEQLPISSMQMDSSISEMSMGFVGSVGYVSGHPIAQPFPLSNKQTTLGSDNPLSHGLASAELQMGQIEAKSISTLQSQQFLTPNNQTGQMGSMTNSVEQMSAPLKRKANMEPTSENRMSENLSIPQKRVAQMLQRPWLQQQMSAQNKKAAQLVSMPNSPGSLNSPPPPSNKKLVKTDSFSNNSGSQRTTTPKSQSARSHPSSKVSTESSESVRSKMREQLAAALSLATEQGNKSSPVGNNCPAEAVISQETHRSSQPCEDSVTNESSDSVGNFSAMKNDVQGESQKFFSDVKSGDSTSIYDSGEFQSSYELSYEDVPFSENFFVKDELLQGNGLSWVLDPVFEMTETGEIQTDGKQKSDSEEVGGDGAEKACHQSPEDVAFEIEAELFKLFGGVNKKYKEKGRSLLFNLKDRNNPELRERVMAGEIPPKRLCSMTAEELASKELSQWRMAKAEELAQMVILPDTEVDIRRLVRKTHKGEFQVEVEQDDNIPADISGGSSSLAPSRSESKEMEIPTKRVVKKAQTTASGGKSNLEQHNLSQALTIPPNDGNDLMQGLMVDDDLKDVDFLPPIVSLDEFMESLHSEPPFEILPVDSERTPLSDKDDFETGSGSKSSDLTTKDVVDASSERCASIDSTHMSVAANVKSSDNNADSKSNDDRADVKSRDSLVDLKSSGTEAAIALSGTSKGEHVWEGSLQLSISSTSNFIGVFKSGEKFSVNEWPELIEIKGRVRLDAFEKFLNQLPLSRSRAVMVVHFVLKEGSSESELSTLQEVSESYVTDERVGFAEPTFGVELYFCPPHHKTLDMLGKVIQKEHVEALNKLNNGLIGVIVWRKLSSTLPKSSSSSRHKHSSKKQQHFTPSRKQQDLKSDPNSAPEPAPRQSRLPPPPPEDDNDDVPPGFGPPAARDEDDLPEFNFSDGPNPPVSRYSRNPRGPVAPKFPAALPTSRPVEQVRELIHKYGQSNATLSPVRSWIDDDDDIPEWQPQVPLQQQQALNFHQSMIRPHYVNQSQVPMKSVQQPINANPENPAVWQQQQQGGWWAGSGQATVQTSNLNCQPEVGQYYGAPGSGSAGQPGMAFQQNVPKSRGF